MQARRPWSLGQCFCVTCGRAPLLATLRWLLFARQLLDKLGPLLDRSNRVDFFVDAGGPGWRDLCARTTTAPILRQDANTALFDRPLCGCLSSQRAFLLLA